MSDNQEEPEPRLHAANENASERSLQPDDRVLRIEDYVKESLRSSDPLQANLGVINGDLMSFAYCFRQAIGNVLAISTVSLDELDDAMPAVDTYLKLVKQVDRLSQLDLKLKKLTSLPNPGPT